MNSQLHIFFLPHFSRSHIIPLVGIGRLIAERGVRVTFVTTPGNISFFGEIEDATKCGLSMQLLLVPFPVVGLPPGCEDATTIPPGFDNNMKLFKARTLLRDPYQQLLQEHNPDCIVSDTWLFWPAGVAASLGIPYIEFSVTSPFFDCIMKSIHLQDAHRNVDPVSGEMAPLEGLPHRLVLRKSEVPTYVENSRLFDIWAESERKSIGVVINVFRELTPEYVREMEKGGKRRVWCVGPVQQRQLQTSDTSNNYDWQRIKKWLDCRQPETVLYVAFGSHSCVGNDQLREIARGLESSGHPFIWVVKTSTMEEWLPEGFKEKVNGRGLVITEWVPQVMILDHPAVGGSIMHCGWSSALESVTAGLLVVAWPTQFDQFIIEKLFVEVLGTAIRVLEGEMRVTKLEEKKLVSGEKVKEVVTRLMGGGEEVKEMRRKAKEYSKLAKLAAEESGSSYADITCLIEEVTAIAREKIKNKT